MRACVSLVIVVCSAVTACAQQPAADSAARIGTGDGVADDTAAIQAAVDRSTGNIQLGKGTYRITKPIVIDLDKVTTTAIHGNGVARIVMEGAGPAFRFKGTHQGTAAPRTFKVRTWDRESSPMVDGLEIVGKHAEACGIEADGTMQLTVTRVVVREALHGIHLIGRNRNVTLSECHVFNGTGVGVFLDHLNLHQINIVGCHISYNDRGGIVLKDSEVRNLQIGSCDIEGNMGGADSEPAANILLDASGTSIGEVAITGCTIQHSHDAPKSANIRILGRSKAVPFTSEQRHGNFTIANNILSDVQVNIDIKDARGVAITGNTIWKGFSSNLVVENCQSVVMSGNVFDRNPRYGYGDGKDAKGGAKFTGCSDCTISGNHFYGKVAAEAALVLRRCQRLNVTGCSILDYGNCGLLLDQVTRSRVSDCLIRDDRPQAEGVSIAQSGDNQVQISDCQLSHP
ncbi:right-handed parallel beta-helix repeat-containing protein [Roseimaritima ulvae]|uniref:Pectate lyase superfamily protein n=1 Tax=Roseimaritima ulvae TaxID=980254 RepID=A0A5B9QRU6_9BACT|nr:right-handed parallel beta-helix repeat-containing protein [Roseimaritima ulvae]QEG40682.1 Pectate lyase superfamily protein [Roseimaritima ulvae]